MQRDPVRGHANLELALRAHPKLQPDHHFRYAAPLFSHALREYWFIVQFDSYRIEKTMLKNVIFAS